MSPEERKTFWIENEYIEAVKGKKEYIFKSGLPHLYLTDPEREPKNRSKDKTYEDELAKNVTIDIRQCKEKVSYENAEWIYVKSHYYKGGKTIYNQGWVEVPKEENRFSAYDWKKFGFKTYDAENHRMYPIKSVNNYEGTSEFIKKIIALIDKNKDGKIQNEELQASYNKPELSHIFSRMVCKHKSEWSYKWEKIEKDAQAFYKYHYPDASDDKIKERLKETKTKYDALYDFWDKLNFKTDTFWYFEPFGWVEQMKRVFSNGELIFPFKKIPLNHPKGFKNDSYKKYDYTKDNTWAAPFGVARDSVRLHAARDLYYEVGEPIYAIADGIVTSIHYYYDTTYAIVIEHDYEYKEGHKLIVLYGEVKGNVKNKEGKIVERHILVNVGDKVVQGQQIAEVGLLYDSSDKENPYVLQPKPDKRGMLHIEMYTGEITGKLTNKMTKYEEMLYAKSDGYNKKRQFQRRKDLFDPLELLEKMLENSTNQGLIK
ncbi:M23 family metallopeptidase [Capnocytophaga cynodegmi]|uniref:M23 family metallopeptidase n=1 Tax=Capnocytophaga cynodegmi TaxID=28189 RepID=UPI003859BCCD